MKKHIAAFLIALLVSAFATNRLFAQSEIDTTVNLDILTIPNSPAFNLLGISPAAVDRPTTPNDFAISLANASNNFSLLPKNYAIEFLPISFFPKSKNSYAKFTNDTTYVKTWNQKLWNTVSQTFLLSGGFSTDDSVNTTLPDFIKTRSGVGFKFSLVRGRIDTAFEDYKISIDTVRMKLAVLHKLNNEAINNYRNTDSTYKADSSLRRSIIKRLIDNKNNAAITDSEKDKTDKELKNVFNSLNAKMAIDEQIFIDTHINQTNKLSKEILAAAAVLKTQIEQIKFKRYGWMVDFAGGMVIGFRNDDFQNSIVQQYALWFNGGYACKKGFSFMGVARYSNALNAVTDSQGSKMDKAFYDLGGKIEFQTDDNKFSVNGEIIDRISTGTPLLRYTFNASYQVGKNQALTFSVGKAFAGTAQYGGNLIAALNYIKTFGSSRSVVPSH